MKPQTIRLLDVAVIGPTMIVAAYVLRRRMPWLAWPLGVFGVATVGYNARNYVRYRGVVGYESKVTVGPPTVRSS